MEVNWLIGNPDDIDGINHNVDQLVGQVRVQLGTERGSSCADENGLLDCFLLNLEGL